ncbi:protein sickie-like [Culicoides brevitarsis]|uniref:protein sickie-like n=1 Tax=Culicoides brevitarsis TaxID=469753 RepID=UPI00307C4627
MGNTHSSVNNLHSKKECSKKSKSLPSSPATKRPAPHTSIPVPATALVQRRCAPDKVRPLPPTPNQSQTALGSKQSKKQGDNHAYDSQQNIVTKENDVRQISKNPASPYTTEPTTTSTTSQQTNLTTTKHSSGLLRLFNKDKTPRVKSQVSSNARASSSSGFSSAKSEKSDSSISLNELQTSTKVKILTDSSKKVKSSGSPKTKNKLLVSKSSKKSSGKSKDASQVEHYTNTNITIVETKGLTPKTIIPSIPKAQKPAVVSVGSQSPSQISQGNRRIEKKSESISNLLTTSTTSNSQLPTPKPVATVKGTTKPPLASSPTHTVTLSNESPQKAQTPTMTDSAKSNNSSESSVLCAPNNNNIKATKEVTTPDVWQQQQSKLVAAGTTKGSPRKVVNGENANNITLPVAVAQNVVNGNKSSASPTVLPMRPLLRGYNNRVTLPRNMKTGQLHADFCEDLRQQGYNSDSDSPLMKSAQRTRYSDVESGYMSEGGSSQFMSLLRNRSQLPTTIEEK